jgi:hypothetical protein
MMGAGVDVVDPVDGGTVVAVDDDVVGMELGRDRRAEPDPASGALLEDWKAAKGFDVY